MRANTSAPLARVSAAIILVGALAAFGTLGVQTALAATIHACVKPKSGATRIVSAKAKCRHGEKKLSWNTTGPKGDPGAPGATGAEGKAGVNGVGTLYAAAELKPMTIETETYIVSKVLPPGMYSVSGTFELAAQYDEKGEATEICALVDTPGTSTSPPRSDLDMVELDNPLVEVSAGEWGYTGTVELEGNLTSTVTSTISLGCGNFGGGKASASAAFARLQAISVTGIL